MYLVSVQAEHDSSLRNLLIGPPHWLFDGATVSGVYGMFNYAGSAQGVLWCHKYILILHDHLPDFPHFLNTESLSRVLD